MKKVLVAGGSGFVGSHLCNLLIEKGYHVVCIDNLITGNKDNIKHLLDNKNFEFIQKDVVGQDLKINSMGYIFNLASPASPVDYHALPEETALTNAFGTLNLLKLATKNKARFLLASTSEIYGDPLVTPQKETYWGNVNSFGPRSCYDESKRFAETLTYIYIQKHNIDGRIVRIFNTYGPRMQKDDGRVVSNFINQALSGKPLTIYGDGTVTRSFCYISDLVQGLYKFMFTDNLQSQIINLGNPHEFTILNFAKKIKRLTNSKSEITFMEALQDDPKQRRPDITKAKIFLNWEPKVDIDEGLLKTIEYYKGLPL